MSSEFVEDSVAYRMSSCHFEKYNPVISGESATMISLSISPVSMFKIDIIPTLEHSLKSNLATYNKFEVG